MWSDNESEVDFLDFAHLKAAVTSIVRTDALLPATIGVFGDWGSGKSTLLTMVLADLEREEGVLCVSFNGWLFEGYDGAKSALMGTILDEIADRRSLSDKAKKAIIRLLRRVDKMKVAGLAIKHGLALLLGGPAALGLSAATDIPSAVKALGGVVKATDTDKFTEVIKPADADDKEDSRKGIAEFRRDFESLLTETGIKKLVVIIDDLDRCSPETIIETLEAIKLFLFVPHTAFILGADERLVQYAVRRRFPELPGERVEVGRDYLEKLVQFPIRVPPLDRAEMETYINLLFVQISGLNETERNRAYESARRKEAGCIQDVSFSLRTAQSLFPQLPPDLVENLRLAEQLVSVLAGGLNGNPRQCKRFLNTLLMRLKMAESRGIALQKRVLAKLMLLEHFRPESFKRLAAIQAQHSGTPPELAVMEDYAQPQKSTPAEARKKTTPTGPEKPIDDSTPDVGESGLTAADLDPSLTAWFDDAFIMDWLRMEPALRDVDLRSYYFFSRDIIGTLAEAVRRLSPAAQDFVTRLLQPSEAVRRTALTNAKTLSQADAAGVFDALSGRVEKTEDLGADGSPLESVLGFTKQRPELLSQAIALLERLPEKALPMNVVPRLVSAVGVINSNKAAVSLLQRWTKGGNKSLAIAAQRELTGKKAFGKS